MGTPRPRAVIFTQRGADLVGRLARCQAHCEDRGYQLGDPPRVIVGDGSGHRWDEAMAMLLDGRADVIVTYARTDPPADRVPRWEAAEDAPPVRRGKRRLRRLPRG